MYKAPRKFVFALLFIAFFASNESLAAREKKIRVLVFESNKIYFKADKEKTFLVQGLGSSWRAIRSLKIQSEKGKFKYSINGNNSKWSSLPRTRKLSIKTRDPRGVWLGSRRYSGELKILQAVNSLKVVNHLGLEKYLISVVGSEMPKDWPIEALKAQAIAARTYALNQLKGKDEYDVDSTIASQVYLGLESDTDSTRKAVKTTKSLVLMYKGRLIDAVFHSSSGGRTEDSSFVWGRYNPYLKSVVDHDQQSPNYSWNKKIDIKKLQQLFPETGGVNAVRVIEKTPTNRVKKIKIYGPIGSRILSGKEIRKTLDLKSTLVKFEILSSFINDNYRENTFLESIKENNLLNIIMPVSSEVNFKFDQLDKLPNIPEINYLLVEGSGSGHGVGMSQWGAKGLAEKGASFRRILKHFYRGVSITNYY